MSHKWFSILTFINWKRNAFISFSYHELWLQDTGMLMPANRTKDEKA